MSNTIPTNCTGRGEAFDALFGTFPDERGTDHLEMEIAIRKETPAYCSQPSVERCSLCSLCSFGRDCHNNAVAKDLTPWTGDSTPMTAEEQETAARFFA